MKRLAQIEAPQKADRNGCNHAVAGADGAMDRKVRGLCRQDGCDEFQVLDKRPVAQGSQGTLFQTRVRTFHASYQGRRTTGDEDGFVYCSRVKPAVISPGPSGARAFVLGPYNLKPDRETTNFYAFYFGLCHGIDAGKAAARDRRGIAAQLQYHPDLTQSQMVTLRSAEEIISN